MTGNEYQQQAMRTKNSMDTVMLAQKIDDNFQPHNRLDNGKEINTGGVVCACLGLTGEAGETADMIKKWIFHDTELDVEHLKKEIGDVMWYVALLCDSFGFSLDEILEMNIEKLKVRYPDGFNTYDANHRKEGDV